MILLSLLVACGPKIDRGPVPVEVAQAPVQVVSRPDPTGPNVYFQAIVHAGSAFDPVGREGLANLTARSMLEAGAGERTGQQLKEALYPTGSEIRQVVDREWVSFRLTCHKDHAAQCLDVFADVLTAPTFAPDDVARVRDEALYAVTDGLLSDEEALGYEVLDTWLFEGHPYGHPVEGRAGVLPTLTAEDAAAFWRGHYLRGTVTAGIAGAVDPTLEATFRERLLALPGELPPELVLMQPAPVEGRSLLAVDTETPVAGFHFGHPLAVERDHADWPALYLAFIAFGEHRQSHGRLFRELRTARGLNYGDYAYVEPFVQRGWSSMPEQGVLRQQPFLYLWLRPTAVENGAFALKLAIAELERFVAEGLTPEAFDQTRTYLLGRLPLLARDPGRRLAYALDAAATGTPDLLDTLPPAFERLTVEQVNAALKRHVRPADLRIVAVSGDAEALVSHVVEGKPTPIVYAEGIEPSEAQAARDEEVAASAVGVTAERARTVPAEGIFR